MYSLKLNGFKTKAQVEEFLSWYSGQGEQDACIWLEIAKDAGKIDVDSMMVDNNYKETWDGNTLVAKLKI